MARIAPAIEPETWAHIHTHESTYVSGRNTLAEPSAEPPAESSVMMMVMSMSVPSSKP